MPGAIGYYDIREREPSDWFNYSDLIMYRPGFVWLHPGDLLLPLRAESAGVWSVSTPLVVVDIEETGDALDIQFTFGENLVVPPRIEAADPRLGGWRPEPTYYPRLMPEAVARALGLLTSAPASSSSA